MKYDASMTQYHDDIVAALKLMCGKDTIAQSNADDASPAPLRDYIKSKYGNSGKSAPGGATYFATPSKGVDIELDGMTVTLSWSQTAKFIRDNTSEIFSEDEPTDEILPDKNSLELLCNTFDESEIKCPFWRVGQTMRYLNFGGVDFKCDYCDCSFCEFDKLTEFLASHCHDYEECIYYRKNKDNVPDDYSECNDVPIPAQTDTTVAAFGYSELDPDTAAKLENVTAEIFNIRKEFIFATAKKVAYAHDLLANHYEGMFGAWCKSIGITRQTGDNYVKVVKLFDNSTLEEQENLNKLVDTKNTKLLYEAARPSAPPELVEQVKSGDITTHKDFIALKKQLEAAEEQNAVLSAEKEQFHKASKANLEKLNEERERNSELEQQIRELESRPVDVVVQSDSDAQRKFNETIRKLNLEFEIFRDDADKELADMRNQRNKALDRAEAAEAQLNASKAQNAPNAPNAPKEESNVKPFLIKMTVDDLSEIIEALSGSPKLQNIMKKVQVLRI